MFNPISFKTLPEFELITPVTLEEALNLLNTYKSESKILAGGTDLIIELKQRLKKTKVIIDIKNISDLNKLELDSEGLYIGACVPISRILKLYDLKSHYNALYQALTDMCDEILIERATIAGNIATASPAADSAGPLLIFKALVEIRSISKGTRRIPIEEFFIGVKKNILESDELITAIIIPLPIESSNSTFKKMKRGVEDIALVGISGFHNKKETLLAYTAVAPTPIFQDVTHVIGNKSRITEEDFRVLWKEISSKIKPISDLRASKEYRIHIAEIFTRLVIKEIL